eukprot:Rmarinus@m.19719
MLISDCTGADSDTGGGGGSPPISYRIYETDVSRGNAGERGTTLQAQEESLKEAVLDSLKHFELPADICDENVTPGNAFTFVAFKLGLDTGPFATAWPVTRTIGTESNPAIG